MAEGEGKSFENPTFEFSGWDDDDDGDEKTPLQPPKRRHPPRLTNTKLVSKKK